MDDRFYCSTHDHFTHSAFGGCVKCHEEEEGPVSAFERQVGGTHYQDMPIQLVEFIVANNIPYLEGQSIKYLVRHSKKNGVEDIDKVIHYCELMKEAYYGEETGRTSKS